MSTARFGLSCVVVFFLHPMWETDGVRGRRPIACHPASDTCHTSFLEKGQRTEGEEEAEPQRVRELRGK